MSRIGIKPIALASTVEVKVENRSVSVKGPLGQLGWELNEGIDVEINEGRSTWEDEGMLLVSEPYMG